MRPPRRVTRPEAVDASVIICTYTTERWGDLQAAVASVRSQTLAPRDVIVVVDHNPELETIAREELGDVRVVPNRYSRGLSGARNSGVEASTSELVAFIDDDAWAVPGWLALLVPAFDDLEVQGAGGGVDADWQDGRPGWFPREFDWVVGCSYRGLPVRPAAVRNPIGANMAFRRRVFEQVGGFRSDLGRIGSLPVGDEETEFCLRIAARNPSSRILYIPNARVIHRVPKGRGRFRYFAQRCFAEGLSKALLRRIAQNGQPLRPETRYVTRTLTSGVILAIGGALRRREPARLLRATAIAAGLGLTVVGFAVGTLRPGRPEVSPVRDAATGTGTR
jgi:glucosyl-dolichyl phosphate glucuronosyltransferase